MTSQKELRDNAQRIFDRLRNNLLNTVQPGNPYAFAHGTPSSYVNSMGGVPAPYKTSNGMGLTFNGGVMPNEKQIADYVNSHPEYRAAVAKVKGGGRTGGGSSRGGDTRSAFDALRARMSTPGSGAQVSSNGAYNPAAPEISPAMRMFNDYYQGVQQDFEEAKAANLARYDEGHGELTGARDYRQQLYQNFGEAASADLDERMQENLKSIKADAARRGLSNSNVPLAFSQRAARDTAREQQRVREMRDSRLADAYAQDTNNLVGFIERREDPYPDVNQALQLGLQLSENEANRAASERRLAMDRQLAANALRGTGGRGRSDVRLPLVPGPQGGVMPMFLNGTPGQMANAFYANNQMPPLAYTSNRYPTRRSPEQYAAIAQQRALKEQQQALEADRNAWYSGRRVMPNPIPFPTYA